MGYEKRASLARRDVNAPILRRHTLRQSPIVRLGIVMDLYHLAPPSGSQNVVYVSDILPPSIRVDSSGHHPAMHQVEGVRTKRETWTLDKESLLQIGVGTLRAIQIVPLEFQI
jgi:hypothetical protein